MKYEYNGNLNIEDRIVNVCNDIKECYPNIPIDKLKKIAALETPIIDNIVNNKFKFKRLYHILLIINNDISLSFELNWKFPILIVREFSYKIELLFIWY